MFHERDNFLQECISFRISSYPKEVHEKRHRTIENTEHTHSRFLNTPVFVIYATRFPSIAFDIILCNCLSRPTFTSLQPCQPRPINFSIFSSYCRVCMCYSIVAMTQFSDPDTWRLLQTTWIQTETPAEMKLYCLWRLYYTRVLVSEDTRGSFLQVGFCDNLDTVVSEITRHPV
jgi:hypothetical protein